MHVWAQKNIKKEKKTMSLYLKCVNINMIGDEEIEDNCINKRKGSKIFKNNLK